MSLRGGDCTPSSTVIQLPPATDSAAIVLHQMARRRKRPRRRPGCRNVPRAPNPPDEATLFHPQPTMGGTSTPTTTLMSARANNRAPRSHQLSLQVLEATTGRCHAPSVGLPTQTASSLPWSSQRTSGAQSARRGHSLPPSTDNGGDFYADNNSRVGASERLGSSFASISLPPTLHH